jgi:cytochrome c peroxidase
MQVAKAKLLSILILIPSPVYAELPWQPIELEDYITTRPETVELGRKLFDDEILSGNRNISCQTCHHPDFGTADGLSLGLGEGAMGVGNERKANEDIRKRVPRHSPHLFNLGHKSVIEQFWDGRVSIDPQAPSGYDSPAEAWLPHGLTSLSAVQATLPVTAQFEMAGNTGENEVIGAVRQRIDYAWPVIVERVIADDNYWQLISAAYPKLERRRDTKYIHLANAIGDYINSEFRSFNAPIDRLSRGEKVKLTDAQQAGMALFYGKGQCGECHSGPLFTDGNYYSLAMPPMGPGRTRQWDPWARDVGRMGVSNRAEDAYAFRVPSLRNLSFTAPYGHNGAYATLRAMIEHHNDPIAGLENYDRSQAILPEAPHIEEIDWIGFADTRELERIKRSVDLQPLGLSDTEIDKILEFLKLLDEDELLARLKSR